MHFKLVCCSSCVFSSTYRLAQAEESIYMDYFRFPIMKSTCILFTVVFSSASYVPRTLGCTIAR
jgi:hypothetical protein